MKLKAVIAKKEDIPEGQADFYTEGEDGQWYLDLEGVDGLPQVTGLVSKKDGLLKTNRRLKDQLKRFEQLQDLEDDELEALLARLDDDGDGGAGGDGGDGKDGDGKIAQLRERLQKKFDRELKKANDRAAALESALSRKTIDLALDQTLADAGITGLQAKAVKALLKAEHGPKMVEEEGAEGPDFKGVFVTDMDGVPGEYPIPDFTKAWLKTDEAAEFMPPSGKGGSGADPEGGRRGTGGQKRYTEDQLVSGDFDLEAVAKGEAAVVEG